MPVLRIGSRPSPLAIKQTELAVAAFKRHAPEASFDIVPISSEGDLNPHQPLSVLGGKGVFIRTLEHALVENRCDIVAHSFKDITADGLDGLTLAGFLRPDVTTDCLVLPQSYDANVSPSLHSLPQGATIGTSALRRKALIHRIRPDLRFKDIRGNVETRIRLCDEGVYDAILLSEAGLVRLGLQHRISASLDPTGFLPAPGQGVIALQCREQDQVALDICRAVTSEDQAFISTCEWVFMKTIGLGCNVPLGLHTVLSDDTLSVRLYIQLASGEEKLETYVFKKSEAISELTKLGKALKAAC